MLDEKDRLTDSLITQKYIASGYNAAAAESANSRLMDTFMGILRDEHQIQFEIFNEMANRGWYTPKMANVSDLTQNLNKWNQELQRVQSTAYRQAPLQGNPATYQPGYPQFGVQQQPGAQQTMYRPPQNPTV